jgi:peptidoglycan/xylan/chitin deacetylase (PgdA/CDA1 family)
VTAPALPSKRALATRLLGASGLGALLRRFPAWRGLVTLAYHRIGNDPRTPFDRGLWSACPEAFDAQLRLLKKHCDVIGADDLADVLRKQSGRHALITFDDGYRDNYEVAFPLLRSHGLTAAFFVATGFLDRPRASWYDEVAWMVRTSRRAALPGGPWFPGPVPFDPPDRARAVRTLLARYKTLPGERTDAYLDFLAEATGSGRCPAPEAAALWMTWDMLREMAAAGMAVGGHTANHPVLARLAAGEQGREVAECKRRLEAELGRPMTCFSYPDGGPAAFDRATRACLREHGVRFAFSYHGGYQRFPGPCDPHDLPRVAVEPYVGPDQFRALLTLPQVFA